MAKVFEFSINGRIIAEAPIIVYDTEEFQKMLADAWPHCVPYMEAKVRWALDAAIFQFKGHGPVQHSTEPVGFGVNIRFETEPPKPPAEEPPTEEPPHDMPGFSAPPQSNN